MSDFYCKVCLICFLFYFYLFFTYAFNMESQSIKSQPFIALEKGSAQQPQAAQIFVKFEIPKSNPLPNFPQGGLEWNH